VRLRKPICEEFRWVVDARVECVMVSGGSNSHCMLVRQQRGSCAGALPRTTQHERACSKGRGLGPMRSAPTPNTPHFSLLARKAFSLLPSASAERQRPCPNASEMANVYRPRKGTVFRVRGIPTDWDEELTESFLADHYGAASTPTVQSLGQEIHQSSKTATLMFLDRDFSMPGVTRTNPVWRVPLKPCDGGRRIGNQYLTLDVDFHGITTLFVPPVDDHKLE